MDRWRNTNYGLLNERLIQMLDATKWRALVLAAASHWNEIVRQEVKRRKGKQTDGRFAQCAWPWTVSKRVQRIK